MTRFLIPMLTSIAVIAAVVFALALYMGSSPNKKQYSVYIDENNRIFINGKRSTEEQVYRLGRDMTIDISIKKHAQASTSFCFQERGCMGD